MLLGWCALMLGTTLSLHAIDNHETIIAVLAVIFGAVALVLARRIMQLPCPICGANLYSTVRAAVRENAKACVCPQCSGHVQVSK